MGSLIRFVGRVFLGSSFVILGWQTAQEPGGRVNAAAELGLPEPELMVRLNGWAMVAGGFALALGILQRLSALILIGSLAPTTFAGHPFWQETDPQKRQGQEIHFLKNLSMIGGLILVLARPKSQ